MRRGRQVGYLSVLKWPLREWHKWHKWFFPGKLKRASGTDLKNMWHGHNVGTEVKCARLGLCFKVVASRVVFYGKNERGKWHG